MEVGCGRLEGSESLDRVLHTTEPLLSACNVCIGRTPGPPPTNAELIPSMLGLSTIAAARAATRRSRPRDAQILLLTSRRPLSATQSPSTRKIDPTASDASSDAAKQAPNPQDFVKVRLEPGEWDEDRTDPTYGPAWKSNTQIMHPEDFANRSMAGFSAEFDSLRDSMTILSWLTQEDREAVYGAYLKAMQGMSAMERGVTSHEYAMRVIAERFNLSPARVAAIVQLEHEEDRMRKERPDDKVHYRVQEYVDAKIRENIDRCYSTFGEEPPKRFIEDPTGASGLGDPNRRVAATVKAEDLFDVDDLLRRAVVRERDEAQLSIDSHVYIEDVDDAAQAVKVNSECEGLMQAKNAATDAAAAFAAATCEGESKGDPSHIGAKMLRSHEQSPIPDMGRGIGGVWADQVEADEDGTPPRRPRWKFAAKMINTRDEKRMGQKERRATVRSRRKKKAAAMGIAHDEDVQNTLVEKGGHLRPATAEEVSNTAWKPVRNQQEFTYAGAKRAWVGHKLRGEKGGWGRVERDLEKERREDEETKKENDLPGGVDDADSGAEGNDGEAPSKAKEGSKGG